MGSKKRKDEGMNGKKEEWGGIREKEAKEREFKGETTTISTTTVLWPPGLCLGLPG